MPQQQPKNAEGYRLLLEFIEAGKQEAERLGGDWFEVEYVVDQMLKALSLNDVATEAQQHNFRIAQSLAGFLLEELVTAHASELAGWRKFDTPQNPVQTLARIFATAIAVFERELRKSDNPQVLGRMRRQVADSLTQNV
ncbi:hypothetical protein [Terriglobus aquaticus]|uniref:MazG nucleotide pyrophosphohydrolase domain-containing protein n=1 Tax=Terriglobus aquaticus TaxID=940139 RepID=A0ABW9KJC3_9BACT|nr:hypothetical protein [Terriglobus aquaticus]